MCVCASPQVIRQEGLSRVTSTCSLYDLLKYDNPDGDTHLTLQEMYSAFGESENLHLQRR